MQALVVGAVGVGAVGQFARAGRWRVQAGLEPAAALGAFARLVQAAAGKVGGLVHALQRGGHPGHAAQLADVLGQHDVQHLVGGHAQQPHGGAGPLAHVVERGVVAAHVVRPHAAEGVYLHTLADADAAAQVGLIGDGHHVGRQQLHLDAVGTLARHEADEALAVHHRVAQRQALHVAPGVAAGHVAHTAAAPGGPAGFQPGVHGGLELAGGRAHARLVAHAVRAQHVAAGHADEAAGVAVVDGGIAAAGAHGHQAGGRVGVDVQALGRPRGHVVGGQRGQQRAALRGGQTAHALASQIGGLGGLLSSHSLRHEAEAGGDAVEQRCHTRTVAGGGELRGVTCSPGPTCAPRSACAGSGPWPAWRRPLRPARRARRC